MIDYNKIKENEKSVLETFQAEIPSVYYSDKSEKEYLAYKVNAEYMYRNLFKFPPEMKKVGVGFHIPTCREPKLRMHRNAEPLLTPCIVVYPSL